MRVCLKKFSGNSGCGGDKEEKEIDQVEKLDFSKRGIHVFSGSHESFRKIMYSLCFVLFSGRAIETFG